MSKTVELEHLRQVVDSLDVEIVELLARRMDLSLRLGEVKKDCHLTAYQPERWREIVETRSAHGLRLGLPEEFIISVFDKIHLESVRRQLEILQPGPGKNVEAGEG